MKFNQLIQVIQQVDFGTKVQTGKAINRMLTCRNWLVGWYISNYEQKGEDRAEYGERLIDSLSEKLDSKSFSPANLKYFRQFYRVYPQIGQSLIDQFKQLNISQSLIGEMPPGTPLPQPGNPPERLISNLSFTHFLQLLPIEENMKRTFYELECMKGSWTVRELKRQINTLYYERSAISKQPALLSQMVQAGAEALNPEHIVKDVYTFEFLGLPVHLAVEEHHLETALLNHLQEFILELGRGFCFEARQQRILIGDEYFFIDLVFYHRILKCHVLVDLKVDEFSHADAGQINTYLNYYKAQVMAKNDNPPVGILLVTNKNDALVQYATAGMDKQLFVKKYQLLLPAKEQLENFIKQELKNAAL